MICLSLQKIVLIRIALVWVSTATANLRQTIYFVTLNRLLTSSQLTTFQKAAI